MASEIKNLAPQPVWGYFYELTQIPRPTGQMKEVTEYIKSVGKSLNLETLEDKVGNILIRKPATPGFENRPVVTLQSHLDMVPQKNTATVHDFTKDPIDAYVEGDWVTARGTTLGADNGIGASYALAVMADNDFRHGPLEALFTIDEEVGMVGANGLKPGFSKGEILINLDSESECELFVGCAGGIDVNASLEYKEEEQTPEGDVGVKLSLTGLRGGHSGMEIDLGRGNANKLMFRFLKDAVENNGARLVEFEGGSLRNAIPREAFATITIPENEADMLWELVSDYQDIFIKEYENIEDGIKFEAERLEHVPSHVVPEEIQDSIINAIEACPNGVISMLTSFPGTVESSSNMARVTVKDKKFEAVFLVRSSSESRKMYLASMIESTFNLAGAVVEFDAPYNGWEPNINSPIMKYMKEAYERCYGKTPEIKVIHAGLECGIIQGVMPDMDMISVGSDIRSPHSPDEKVHIASVERTWNALKDALTHIE
ncbi:aminoacyl-histidine dipeptidase [Porphyromonas macacae]|uniref:aminoacyl-histidine dipeptidase n=1 Tax=Porphyromonas macacae TaxID=28115 RepID=UPI0024ACCA56|nr:aminoacyl-histidine dipeptidase [Porphyromonas macacae]